MRPTCSTATPVIDVDTHLTEPPDVWTARVPARAARRRCPTSSASTASDVWMAGGERLGAPGYYSMAGLGRRHAGVDPEDLRRHRTRRCTTPTARLAFLDEQGIHAQVLYPNVGGFGNGYFLRLGDRELVAAVRRAPTTTSSPTGAAPTPTGCSPITALPFWDVDLADRRAAPLHRRTATGP